MTSIKKFVTAKIKPNLQTNSGMYLTGTCVATSAAGTFKFFRGHPPASPSPPPAGPTHFLATYYQSWDASYAFTAIPLHFTHVFMFHFTPAGPNPDTNNNGKGIAQYNGRFEFKHGWNVTQAQIQIVRNRGQKVIVTCGGANNGYLFETRTESTNFVSSFQSLYTTYGPFDGIDFNNFEAAIMTTQAQTNVMATEMSWIVGQLRAAYGSGFLVTAPPNPSSALDKSLLSQMNTAGALSWASPQYYDWVGFTHRGYISGLTGPDQFSGINQNKNWVDLLGANKVMLGLPANLPGDQLTLARCLEEWDECVRVYPTQLGVFCWNAQSNLSGGNVWGSTFYTRLGLTHPV